jgi:hypothetical protein
MTRTRFSFFVAGSWLLLFSMENACAAQDSALEPLTFPHSDSQADASLKVRLRLEDESPFPGAARVSLLPDDGYEIIGTPTGTDGETQFSGMLTGKYIVETSAPGYLTVRRTMQIEAVHRQRILYVVMKPRPVVQDAEKKQAETTTAATLPAAGTRLSRHPNQP